MEDERRQIILDLRHLFLDCAPTILDSRVRLVEASSLIFLHKSQISFGFYRHV